MAVVPIGSQKTDAPKTPTLRQFAKANPDNVPRISVVNVLFLPSFAPNYSLVADGKFRVQVLEDNPLHGIITDELENWSEEGICLAIQVDDAKRGHWTLTQLSNEIAEWESKSWGYLISIKDKPKTRSKKTTRSDVRPQQLELPLDAPTSPEEV